MVKPFNVPGEGKHGVRYDTEFLVGAILVIALTRAVIDDQSTL
jgi:hypothetical protein